MPVVRLIRTKITNRNCVDQLKRNSERESSTLPLVAPVMRTFWPAREKSCGDDTEGVGSISRKDSRIIFWDSPRSLYFVASSRKHKFDFTPHRLTTRATGSQISINDFYLVDIIYLSRISPIWPYTVTCDVVLLIRILQIRLRSTGPNGSFPIWLYDKFKMKFSSRDCSFLQLYIVYIRAQVDTRMYVP